MQWELFRVAEAVGTAAMKFHLTDIGSVDSLAEAAGRLGAQVCKTGVTRIEADALAGSATGRMEECARAAGLTSTEVDCARELTACAAAFGVVLGQSYFGKARGGSLHDLYHAEEIQHKIAKKLRTLVMMMTQTVEIEAETLEEAREHLKPKIPKGLDALSEEVVSDGKPKTLRVFAETTELAYAQAEGHLSPDVIILERREAGQPAQRVETVEAFDEVGATAQLKTRLSESDVIKALRVVQSGKKGFLGIGKKMGRYQADVLQRAAVTVTYRARAKISVKVGRPIALGEGDSYARMALQMHMDMEPGEKKSVEILGDVLRVVDHCFIGSRTIAGRDFLTLTEQLEAARGRGLDSVRAEEAELKLVRPILAALKRIVLVRDCGFEEDTIPDDVDKILSLKGPREVDRVVEYLSGVGLA